MDVFSRWYTLIPAPDATTIIITITIINHPITTPRDAIPITTTVRQEQLRS